MKATRTEMPKVEKGIPCPFGPFKRPKRSRWFDFLKALQPGESFLLTESELINVTHIARQLQVPHRVKHGPHDSLQVPEGQARMWRMPDDMVEDERGGAKVTAAQPQRRKPGPKPKESINLL